MENLIKKQRNQQDTIEDKEKNDRPRERGTKRWSEIEQKGWRSQICRGQKNKIFLLQNRYKVREEGSETYPEETLKGSKEVECG